MSDVTLSGTAHRIAGSDDEIGTSVLMAVSAGASRLELSLPSGSRTEVRNSTTDPPAGEVAGPDDQAHAIPRHNLLVEPAWFFPEFTLARGLSNSTYAVNYIGHETWNSVGVEHLAIYKQVPASSSGDSIVQHLSQQDFYLDSVTLLPRVMKFNAHPDWVTTQDIALEIEFSDYRNVGGVQIPFHVQKYVNGSLTLDLQFQSAVINSGVSVARFSIGN